MCGFSIIFGKAVGKFLIFISNQKTYRSLSCHTTIAMLLSNFIPLQNKLRVTSRDLDKLVRASSYEDQYFVCSYRKSSLGYRDEIVIA